MDYQARRRIQFELVPVPPEPDPLEPPDPLGPALPLPLTVPDGLAANQLR
jgi:hypothetical protein